MDYKLADYSMMITRLMIIMLTFNNQFARLILLHSK